MQIMKRGQGGYFLSCMMFRSVRGTTYFGLRPKSIGLSWQKRLTLRATIYCSDRALLDGKAPLKLNLRAAMCSVVDLPLGLLNTLGLQ